MAYPEREKTVYRYESVAYYDAGLGRWRRWEEGNNQKRDITVIPNEETTMSKNEATTSSTTTTTMIEFI